MVGVQAARGGQAGVQLRPSPDQVVASHQVRLSGPSTVRQCCDRRQGLHQAARRAGLDPDEVIVEVTLPVLNAQGGESGLAQLLKDERRPSAIFCVNDMVAVGVLRGLEERGIAAPGEMSVVGYDDVEFASLLSPALTSIRMPKQQLGRAAAELLVTDFRGDTDHWHQEIVFQPELVVRASTSPPDPSGPRETRRTAQGGQRRP
ncbi:MAG: substrate-binding domain-containing protein [Nonomuraea sp.]|nr:substrate-binding domain-containing protein [Nonomuraea sp.]